MWYQYIYIYPCRYDMIWYNPFICSFCQTVASVLPTVSPPFAKHSNQHNQQSNESKRPRWRCWRKTSRPTVRWSQSAGSQWMIEKLGKSPNEKWRAWREIGLGNCLLPCLITGCVCYLGHVLITALAVYQKPCGYGKIHLHLLVQACQTNPPKWLFHDVSW